MKYVSYETNLTRNNDFIDAKPAQIGAWFRLMTYCAETENGGEISHCQQWSDKKWLATCGLTRKEVMTKNPLLRWRGDTLIVAFYPVENEERVREMSESGRKAANARWQKGKEQSHCASNTPASIEQCEGNANSNSKERKGKVNPPTVPQGDREKEEASVLPSSCPPVHDTPPSPPKPPSKEEAALRRAKALFRIRDKTLLDRGQTTAWRNAREVVMSTTEADWHLLEWRYKLPPNNPHAQYRRKDLAQLLNNWNGEISRATDEADKMGAALGIQAEQKPEAPENWQGLLFEHNSEYPPPVDFFALPESIRSLIYELARARNYL